MNLREEYRAIAADRCRDCGMPMNTPNKYKGFTERCAPCNKAWWKPALDELANDPSLHEE